MTEQAIGSPRGGDNHFDEMLEHFQLPNKAMLVGCPVLFRSDDPAYPDLIGKITGATANGDVLLLFISTPEWFGNPINNPIKYIAIGLEADVAEGSIAATLGLQNAHRKLTNPLGFEYEEPSEVGFVTILKAN